MSFCCLHSVGPRRPMKLKPPKSTSTQRSTGLENFLGAIRGGRNSMAQTQKSLHAEQLESTNGSEPRRSRNRMSATIGMTIPSNATASLSRQSQALQVAEVTEGSLRKLEHLTGLKIVPSPLINNTPRGRNSAVILQSAATDRGTTYASTDFSSSDISPRYPSLGHIYTPLKAPPHNTPMASTHAPPRSGSKGKRVSFTYDRYSQSKGHRQSFPGRRSLNRTLPPLPSLSPVRVPDFGDYGSACKGKGRADDLPALPTPVIVRPESSSTDSSGVKALERYHRRSWSGRSVLELDETSTPEPPQGQFLTAPKYRQSFIQRKPVPPSKTTVMTGHASLPPLESSTMARLPLQEISRLTDLLHSPARSPRISVAPRVDSMAGETIHVPIPKWPEVSPPSPPTSPANVSPLVPMPPGTGEDTASAISTVSSFDRGAYASHYQSSFLLTGLPPPPARSPLDEGASEIGALYGESEGVARARHDRFSVGGYSLADTVQTDDTTGTMTTERELAMEMERIRERAKRASVQRKRRRREEEERAAGKGKGKERERAIQGGGKL
ncbi:hypothetical protein BDZ91DRAFT_561408 [Kalaharituber pfeilii]|nr:hypothetical protein BDZ91DRAFT_561408 [Kalaharituber pfeilii]